MMEAVRSTPYQMILTMAALQELLKNRASPNLWVVGMIPAITLRPWGAGTGAMLLT